MSENDEMYGDMYVHLQNHIFFKDGKFYNVEKEEIPIIFITSISARRVYLPSKVRALIKNFTNREITIEFMDRRERAILENDALKIENPIHYKGPVQILAVNSNSLARKT